MTTKTIDELKVQLAWLQDFSRRWDALDLDDREFLDDAAAKLVNEYDAWLDKNTNVPKCSADEAAQEVYLQIERIS